MPKERPLVGFDRFIRWEWAERALELAYLERPLSDLKEYVYTEVEGKDSARKTFNMLTNLWFETYPNTPALRQRALALYPGLSPQEHLVLHWGMALANFPFFQQTVTIMGRLLRLQGSFQGKEIAARTNELYSNLNTIPRATARCIQTLAAWGVLQVSGESSPEYRAAPPCQLKSPALIHWLIEADMIETPERQWRVIDLLRAPGLFPFEFSERGLEAIYQNKSFILSKDSFGEEKIELRKEIFARR
jgi:hypothetical protein